MGELRHGVTWDDELEEPAGNDTNREKSLMWQWWPLRKGISGFPTQTRCRRCNIFVVTKKICEPTFEFTVSGQIFFRSYSHYTENYFSWSAYYHDLSTKHATLSLLLITDSIHLAHSGECAPNDLPGLR